MTPKDHTSELSRLFRRALLCQEMVDFGGKDWADYAEELAKIMAITFPTQVNKLIHDEAVRARKEAANNIWQSYKLQYPDDKANLENWLRSFVIAENITPAHLNKREE